MEGKFEIVAIPNKYKDTLNDLIDSSDTESQDRPDSSDWSRLIDKKSCNTPRYRNSLQTLSKEACLDEDVSVMSLKPVPKIQVSQVHQRHDVAPFSLKSERAQYGNGQKDRKKGKDERSRENRQDKRGGRGYWGNKIKLVVEESSGFEASNYYHMIY